MPHFKCVPCKARLSWPAGQTDVDDLCPRCGSVLEPVSELSEIVGFQAIEPGVDGSLSPEALAEAIALPKPGRTTVPTTTPTGAER